MSKCIYCNSEVVQDEPGWGLTLEGGEEYFHLECLQQIEGTIVPVEEES